MQETLGMPGLAGFVAELRVFMGTWTSLFNAGILWTCAGIFGAWITAVYVLRGTRAIFWGPGPDTERCGSRGRKGRVGGLGLLADA